MCLFLDLVDIFVVVGLLLCGCVWVLVFCLWCFSDGWWGSVGSSLSDSVSASVSVVDSPEGGFSSWSGVAGTIVCSGSVLSFL